MLNENDKLFSYANDYYKFFLENDYGLIISTISIAEFCVKGSLDNLPLKDLQILPFNLDHAGRAGDFAKEIFQSRENLAFADRKIIPNDTNLFAQSDVDKYISFYLSSDGESKKIYDFLNGQFNLSF